MCVVEDQIHIESYCREYCTAKRDINRGILFSSEYTVKLQYRFLRGDLHAFVNNIADDSAQLPQTPAIGSR
jgi:uncharacterized protein (DUF2252 family)